MSTRKPLVGEVVTSPDGDGVVVSVLDYEDQPLAGDQEFEAYLRAKLGRSFAQLYFTAEVELVGGGEIQKYEYWELTYDAERDPEKAPWRESEEG